MGNTLALCEHAWGGLAVRGVWGSPLVFETFWGKSVRVKSSVAIASVAAVVISLFGAVPTASAAEPVPAPAPKATTVSADALPTAQINGIVWDQAVVGNIVYAGGEFSKARPAGAALGTSEVVRTNLMSYNITTGVMTSFAPIVNGAINAVEASPDGSRLYIGGTFTTVNGKARSRVAAFDTSTGQVVDGFNPAPNAVVRGIATTDDKVFITGNFTQAGGVDRDRAAALTHGGVLQSWAPSLNGRGNAIAASPDGAKIVIGGIFTTLNGSSNPGYGLGMVDAVSGGSLPFSTNNVVRNAGTSAGILSLKTDGDSVYGTGFHFGPGGTLEGIFRSDWENGDLTWVEDCHGDTYDVAVMGDAVYGAGHPHYCGSLENGYPQSEPWTFYRAVAFTKNVNRITPSGLGFGYYDWGGNPAPDLLHWFPEFNAGTVSGATQGPWSVTANSEYVVYAGEFTRVNGVVQQGLARFTTREEAPAVQGPRGANTAPSAVAIGDGRVRISLPLAWDRDEEYLTYRLIRDGKNAAPIQEKIVRSKSPDWGLPPLVFTDEGLIDGATHTYRVRVNDSDGNVAWGTAVSVAASGSTQPSAYRTAVLADSPLNYWPLNDSAGPSYDWAGGADLTVQPGVQRGEGGALSDASTSATFDGTSNGLAATTARVQAPQKFAVEAWFKTTSTAGGKIVGFGNASSGNSTSYDRHVYMDTSGRVNFGVYPGQERVVSSGKSYNDGAWHQVVANLGETGMTLYVDGKLVAQRDDTVSGQEYAGFWRVGGDSSWSGTNYFSGSIDEVAVYAAPLERESILNHFVASGRESVIPPAPSDSYGAAVYGSSPSLYWRLSESDSDVARDSSGQESEGNYSGSLTKSSPGALEGIDNDAVTFAGGAIIGQTPYANPLTYSLESWVKTTSTTGGKIIGFGDNPNGDSGNYDRHVYMLDDGRVTFGVYTGSLSTIESAAPINDGQWHHVVASQSNDGLKLYIDGLLVASNGTNTAQSYVGYWHVGRDVTWGGSSDWSFHGDIDEVAVYPQELSLDEIQLHHLLGATGTAPNIAPTADFTSTVERLKVTVEATAADVDGTIESFEWNWGDGSPNGAGSSATHTYDAGGAFNVVLTVTDDDGATVQVMHPVDPVGNQAPVAAFTSSETFLDVSVDARTSADSDGTVASYSWNWGDGTPDGTGAQATHSYATAGSHTIVLTVVDDLGASSSAEKTVVSAAPPENSPPAAAVTVATSGLSVSADASGSSDADGTVASYSWNWGDNSPATTGVTSTHTYASAGEFTVTVTVIDDDGASSTASKVVTVLAPPASTVLALDGFGRVVQNGFGVAETGGTWTVGAPATQYSTAGGVATFTHARSGQTYNAFLAGVASTTAVVTADLTMLRPTSGSAYASVIARRVGAEDYRTRIVVGSTGAVSLQLQRSNSTLAAVGSGLSIVNGEQLKVKVEASGTNPTTVRAKVWKSGQTEPAAWTLTQQDSAAGLQMPGSVGLSTYLGSTITPIPFAISFDNFSAVTPGTPVGPVNAPPVASLGSTTSGLNIAVDGSGSSDTDGTITSHSWNWGDGTPVGSGATATHTYGSGGSFTVTLTVTDNQGATHSTSATVAVAPVVVPGAAIALDSFERVAADSWGTAETGGAWTGLAPAVDFSVAGGAGVMKLSAGAIHNAYLSSVSTQDASVYTEARMAERPAGGSVYLSVLSRRIGNNDYRARAVIGSTGAVNIQIQRSGTTISAISTGLVFQPGETIRVRTEAVGVSPTTLRVKVWKSSVDEPANWGLTVEDSTAALQAAGYVGVSAYSAATVTNVPYSLEFRSFRVDNVASVISVPAD